MLFEKKNRTDLRTLMFPTSLVLASFIALAIVVGCLSDLMLAGPQRPALLPGGVVWPALAASVVVLSVCLLRMLTILMARRRHATRG